MLSLQAYWTTSEGFCNVSTFGPLVIFYIFLCFYKSHAHIYKTVTHITVCMRTFSQVSATHINRLYPEDWYIIIFLKVIRLVDVKRVRLNKELNNHVLLPNIFFNDYFVFPMFNFDYCRVFFCFCCSCIILTCSK